MATTFKTLTENDRTILRNELHEAIPITGTLITSGTYSDANIKDYSHGLFQSVYDYPFLSSSANNIFALTVGYSNNSALSAAANVQNAEKINIYNQMAKVLVGLDATGSIRDFDQDGDLSGGTKIKEAIFINFARLLTKDGIQKGSFNLELGVGSDVGQPISSRILVKDTAATASWKTNSPAGEYGILTASNSTGSAVDGSIVGLVYYQAGIAVLTASLFNGTAAGGILSGNAQFYVDEGTLTIDQVLTGSQISGACSGFRERMFDVDFNNTIELNSTVYFLRLGNGEFNYSSNPTYLTASKIRTKNVSQDPPVAYVTTVGLFSNDNELLACGKLSEPIKKTAGDEIIIRARIDF